MFSYWTIEKIKLIIFIRINSNKASEYDLIIK